METYVPKFEIVYDIWLTEAEKDLKSDNKNWVKRTVDEHLQKL